MFEIEDIGWNEYRVFFYGREILTEVIEDSRRLAQWIRLVRSPVIGIDVRFFRNRPVVLSLSVGFMCAVVRLNRTSSNALNRFLDNAAYTFVGLNINYLARELYQRFRLNIDVRFELRSFAPAGVNGGIRFHHLAGQVGGILDPERRSLWNHDLDLYQIMHATVNAFIAYEIGRRNLN